jgi:hypothetical protein
MIIKPDFYYEAVTTVHPTVETTEMPEGGAMSAWDIDGNSITLDNSKITIELNKLEAKYVTQAYARNRAAEYPSQGDQNDMMYKDTKNSTTTHADAVEAVKTKWPKDNSGPVE